MVKVKNSLVGQKFGRLEVLYQVDDYIEPNGCHKAKYHCKCDCGNEKDVIAKSLKDGNTKSCGCYNQEQRRNIHKKYNKYDLSGEYGIGYTAKGKEFYFDLEDYNLIKDYCWCFDGNKYIATRNKKGGLIRIHRLIMNCPKDMVVDHIDHNPLNNRKSNLRICTTQQNNMNKSFMSNNTSGTIGVSWDKRSKQWRSRITVNGKEIYLGLFNDIKDAIEARQNAEQKYFII